MKFKRRGLLVVLSSPSGGGKTTVAHRLLEKDRNLVRSVSCTTRPRRQGEKNGRDYFFVTEAKFKKMVKERQFLEWAKVHGRYYGTPQKWVENKLESGRDVLFVIDVQGGRSLRRLHQESVLIFLVPPSFSVLKKRLLGRQSDDFETIRVRLGNARREMKQGRFYDHRVVNDKLPRAVSDILKLLKKARKTP